MVLPHRTIPMSATSPTILADRLNSGVILINRMLDITPLNRLALDLFGVDVPLAQPITLQSCLQPTSDEFCLLATMMEEEKEYRDIVVTWEANGRIRHVLIDSFWEPESNRDRQTMCVIFKDLGNFTAMEQQMQRNDKLATAGKIAAGIAHEIRNPLTTIRGFLQVMEHRHRAEGHADELAYTEVMLREIDRVNVLVSELLLLAKPHQVRKAYHPIQDILNAINPLVETQALLRGIEYHSEVEGNPGVIVDADMMKQVLLNLTKNALEAMEDDGIVKVHAFSSETHVQIDVTDTGPGIPYYQMDRVFEAFFTTKDKGTGLGLPICQRIVHDHGGEIRVSSKGFGTTFSIVLPLAPSNLEQ